MKAKMNYFDVISYPLVTEKSTRFSVETDKEAQDKEAHAKKKRKYFFRVHPKATKQDIREAVENAFTVKVRSVNTFNVLGKMRRVRYQPGYASNWKKAVVTLKPGQEIKLTP